MKTMAVSASEKRARLQRDLRSGRLLRYPGAFSPIVAMLIAEQGWDGVYVSGSALAADLGYPDVGLTTLSEVATRGGAIARATDLPTLVDIDTGFGGPLNTARAVQELEEAGAAGCHLEDQLQPKRCGHLDGKQLIGVGEMVVKLRAAVRASREPDFLLIARTDARAEEGLPAAIERARAYVDAGAGMIFPEALEDEREFSAFREALPDTPLLANMTEFGKSPLLTAPQLEALGFNVVIYPVTTLRLALQAVERGLAQIQQRGSQRSVLPNMMHRQRIYQLLGYDDSEHFETED